MISKLMQRIAELGAPICVGLDPTMAMIPDSVKEKAFEKYGRTLKGAAAAALDFNIRIMDATADLVPAVKPQIAMYEQFGVEGVYAYQETVREAKKRGLIVIGDAKRGDIGSTSAAYAEGHLGGVDLGDGRLRGFDTDFLTVNPYLGTDGVKPFVDICSRDDRGIFVLVKTSNPSSGEFQDRISDGKPIYEHVADKVNEWGEACMDGSYSNVGAVVGATYPEIGQTLRARMPHIFFLVPGYGAQGAGAKDIRLCFDKDGCGAIVNSSRGIIAAYKQEKYKKFGSENFELAAREAVKDMTADLRSVL